MTLIYPPSKTPNMLSCRRTIDCFYVPSPPATQLPKTTVYPVTLESSPRLLWQCRRVAVVWQMAVHVGGSRRPDRTAMNVPLRP
jgi:hypothetical protein